MIGLHGKQRHKYIMDPQLERMRGRVIVDTSAKVNNDTSLQGVAWQTQDGVSTEDGGPAESGSSIGGYHFDLKDTGPNFGVSAKVVSLDDDLKLTVEIKNTYIRHMGLYAVFEKSDGTPISFDLNSWITYLEPKLADGLQEMADWLRKTQAGSATHNYSSDVMDMLAHAMGAAPEVPYQFISTVSSETTVLGVPVSAADRQYTFTIPSDEEVARIRLLVGSLGHPSGNEFDPGVAWLGIGMTAIFDLLIPVVSLAMAVGQETNTMVDALKSKGFILGTAADVYSVAHDAILDQRNLGGSLETFISDLSGNLMSGLMNTTEMATALAAQFGAEEVEEAVPIIGWAMKAEIIEGTIEQLIQTVAEVTYSPRVVEFDLTITMDTVVTLKPGKITKGKFRTKGEASFPATATNYLLTAIYSDNTTRVTSGALDAGKDKSFTIPWRKSPVGGTVVFVVSLYSDDGQLVGFGHTKSLENKLGGSDTLDVVITVYQRLYQLDANTRYRHKWITETKDGARVWTETDQAPTETTKHLATGNNSAAQLESLNGLHLNNYLGILGYSWQATDTGLDPAFGEPQHGEPLYLMQNIAFGDTIDAGFMRSNKGFKTSPKLAYPHLVAPMTGVDIAGNENGLFFFLDPSPSKNGQHLRRLKPVIDPAIGQKSGTRVLDMTSPDSWGRFALQPTSMAIHSNGYVVAVSSGKDMLQVLQLPHNATDDDSAPLASCLSGPGTRPGLVNAPELVAIAPDQTIFVLEAGNHRIQAFSKGGSPVRSFSATDSPYFMPLAEDKDGVNWVSLNADQKGFLYVFSYLNQGFDPDDYRLDVYTPTGSHLFRQTGLVAGAIAVDLWRNVFALNYATYTGPNGHLEPSISEWIPHRKS